MSKYIFHSYTVKILLLLLFVISMGAPLPLIAQTVAPKIYIEMGASLHGNTYLGDFTDSLNKYNTIMPGFSLSAQFSKKRKLYQEVMVGYAKITGQLPDYKSFASTTEFIEPSRFFNTSYYFADFRLKYAPFGRKYFTPFVGVGLGGMRFTPFDERGVSLATNPFSRLTGESYNQLTYRLSGLAGVRFLMSDDFSLFIEYNYQYVGSDYLDNVSKLGSVPGKDVVQSLSISAFITLEKPNGRFLVRRKTAQEKEIEYQAQMPKAPTAEGYDYQNLTFSNNRVLITCTSILAIGGAKEVMQVCSPTPIVKPTTTLSPLSPKDSLPQIAPTNPVIDTVNTPAPYKEMTQIHTEIDSSITVTVSTPDAVIADSLQKVEEMIQNNPENESETPETGISPTSDSGVSPSTSSAYVTHIVKAGETLFKISTIYKVNVAVIKVANKMTDENIKEGQKLLIPKQP